MVKIAGTLVLWLISGCAFALSCLPQTTERFYDFYVNAEPDRVLAYGTLEMLGPAPVYNEKSLSYEPESYETLFRGVLGTTAGFVEQAEFPVTVTHQCMDEACGAIPAVEAGVIQLDGTPDGYEFLSLLCNDTLLANPTPDDLDWLAGCLGGADCSGVSGQWILDNDATAVTLSFWPDDGSAVVIFECELPQPAVQFTVPYESWATATDAGIHVTFRSGPVFIPTDAAYGQRDSDDGTVVTGTLNADEIADLLLASDTLVIFVEHTEIEFPLDSHSDAASVAFQACQR